MRAQCCICQELFENDSELVISALQCGHTFHGECLNQWLESGSSTCPSCRQTVVRKRIIDRFVLHVSDRRGVSQETPFGLRFKNFIHLLKIADDYFLGTDAGIRTQF